MDKKQFIDALFARAKEAGFEACEVYHSTSSNFNVNVLNGEILSYSVNDRTGLGFRGLFDGKMGYASTQILDESAIDLLIDGAKTNAQLIEDDDKQFLYDGSGEYAQVDLYNPAIDEVSAADKIEMARELEKLTMAKDPRIVRVGHCSIQTASEETNIVNTLGLNVSSRVGLMVGVTGPVAQEGDKVNDCYSFASAMDPAKLDLDKAATEAVETAIIGLNAEPIESGAMHVLLHPDAAMDLLATFDTIFSADVAQKGMSLLKGREGETIAAECVTIVDNPHMPNNAASTAFDGEGVPTYVKNIVENGKLTTLLHNLKTAHKQGVKTTGNAYRGGYASTVGVAATNLYFKPTEATEEEMLAKLGDGLQITEVSGLHAGANSISGDFSLSAKGFRVRDGKKCEAVNQITVAGNFYQLLKDIEAVGGDLKFSVPSSAMYGSPSLLISSLSIAGK